MKLRIHIEVCDDAESVVEHVHPFAALFAARITSETVENAKAALGEALERHTRRNTKYDGLPHWDDQSHRYSVRYHA